MAVEPVRQIPQKRVARIGGHVLDNQAMAGDAQTDGLAGLEESGHAANEAVGGVLEVGMAGRVHRTLMQNDGKLDQEISELSGKRGDGPRSRSGGGWHGLDRR